MLNFQGVSFVIPRDPGSITETENGFMEAKGPMRFEGDWTPQSYPIIIWEYDWMPRE